MDGAARRSLSPAHWSPGLAGHGRRHAVQTSKVCKVSGQFCGALFALFRLVRFKIIAQHFVKNPRRCIRETDRTVVINTVDAIGN